MHHTMLRTTTKSTKNQQKINPQQPQTLDS